MFRRFFLLILLLGLLAGCEQPQSSVVSASRQIQEGSVIFWDHGPLYRPIYRHTDSTLSHAAIILYVGNEPWVYEAVPPRVRRLPLADYVRELEIRRARRPQFSWLIMQPRELFSATEIAAMKKHTDSQLGRRYMMRGWWKGYEVRGVMCSQFVADTLETIGRITSAHYRESPGSLHAKLLPVYR